MTERNIGLEILDGIREIRAFQKSTAFPKIKSVKALPNHRLRVVFDNDIAVIYDFAPLLNELFFSSLRDEALFNSVRVDSGGYGISWNDEIDLSESELWLLGAKDSSMNDTQLEQ